MADFVVEEEIKRGHSKGIKKVLLSGDILNTV